MTIEKTYFLEWSWVFWMALYEPAHDGQWGIRDFADCRWVIFTCLKQIIDLENTYIRQT